MKIESTLSDRVVFFSELNVKNYKNFLKETYGQLSELNLKQCENSICDLLANSIDEPLESIRDMDLIDVLSLILELRIVGISPLCKILVNVPGKNKPTSVDFNLDLLKNDLISLNKKLHQTIQFDAVTIKLGCPSFNSLLLKERGYRYIKSIQINECKLTIKTEEDLNLAFNSLPSKIFLEVNKISEHIEKTFEEYSLLARYNVNQKLTFYPNIYNILWFTKLVFSEDLQVFYTTFFNMCYAGHMDANYLESITLGEYNFFVNCLRNALNPPKNSEELPPVKDSAESENSGF